MKSCLRTQFACLLIAVAAVACATNVFAQCARPGNDVVTPVPKVTGPLPVSSDSVPFLAADKNLEPTDLKKHGYIEEEFIVTGTANVYDWAANGALTVKTPNVPYGTRVLVRRPADPGRFSGDVVVEPLNTVRRNDWSWMWGYLDEQIMQHGDAWIGITLPSSSQALKKFNPARYAAVSFPNPTPTPCATGGNNAVSDVEDGLKWDAISQVGALLKSNVAPRPLAGYRVQALYMTEGQSPDPMTYINAIHSHANLQNGKSVYDGYLVKQPGNPARISKCAPALDASDPRRTFKASNSPVIAVLAQGELLAALPWRRADRDAPGDRSRLHAIAGGIHLEWAAYVGMASFQEQTAAGIMPPGTPDWPIAGKC